jgi:hypothetical protein
MTPVTPADVIPWIKYDRTDPAQQIDFYLGTHRPGMLETSAVPLFVPLPALSERRDQNRMPQARIPWAMDSGGFTELQRHGDWRMGPDEFGGTVLRVIEECGTEPDWVATQDWMCEEPVIKGGTYTIAGRKQTFAGTGLSVRIHQELTVENYLYLAENFPMVRWARPLQGYTVADYLRCVDMYDAAGVDLADGQVVALGSVCRRQSTDEIVDIVTALHARGVRRMHGFGVKIEGLRRVGHLLSSADSLAWSYGARRDEKMAGCEHGGLCNNCYEYAIAWRQQVLEAMRCHRQLGLDLWSDLAAAA